MFKKLGMVSCVLIFALTMSANKAEAYGYGYGNGNWNNYYHPYYGNQSAWWGWNRGATVMGDYMRGLAQLRMATAQAAYSYALARQERARARALERFIASLRADLYFIDKELWKVRKMQDTINQKGRSLGSLIEGKFSTSTKIACSYFLRLLDGKALETLLTEKLAPFSDDDFVQTRFVRTLYNKETKSMEKVEVKVEPFRGGSVVSLIEWLGKNPVEIKLDTAAHLQMIKLRTLFIEAGFNWLKALEDRKLDLQNNRVDIWSAHTSGIGSLPRRVLP